MARSNRWLALAMLACTYGCATRGIVRLEAEGRAPLVYRSPSDARVVAVGQREFLDTLARLTLNEQLLLSLEEFGRTEPGLARVDGDWRWEPDGGIGRRRPMWGRLALLTTSSSVDAAARFTLTGSGLHLDDRERQNLAMSYALDAVWDGVAQAVRAAVDPVALKAMVSAALCAYMMLVVLPEPVTKFIAIALTAYLVAYVGLGPLWTMVEAYEQMREACARATSLVEVEDAGHRFGRVLGDNGARVLVMVALAAAGGRAGMSVRGPTLPGYAAAAVAAEANAGLRLATVAQGAVRSFTLRPGALILGVAPTAVASMAWDSSGGGATKPKGRLTGRPSRTSPKDKPEKIRAFQRENESARTLAEHGYNVEQNPPRRPGSSKEPDYRIDGEYYDCYAPSTDNPRNIASQIRDKIDAGQVDHIVLNLDDSAMTVEVFEKQMADWPIAGLKKLIVIRNKLVVQMH